jgi:hypothetical protein
LRSMDGEEPKAGAAGDPAPASFAWQHCLNFLPLPQGQGSLRPTFVVPTGAAPIPLMHLDLACLAAGIHIPLLENGHLRLALRAGQSGEGVRDKRLKC